VELCSHPDFRAHVAEPLPAEDDPPAPDIKVDMTRRVGVPPVLPPWQPGGCRSHVQRKKEPFASVCGRWLPTQCGGLSSTLNPQVQVVTAKATLMTLELFAGGKEDCDIEIWILRNGHEGVRATVPGDRLYERLPNVHVYCKDYAAYVPGQPLSTKFPENTRRMTCRCELPPLQVCSIVLCCSQQSEQIGASHANRRPSSVTPTPSLPKGALLRKRPGHMADEEGFFFELRVSSNVAFARGPEFLDIPPYSLKATRAPSGERRATTAVVTKPESATSPRGSRRSARCGPTMRGADHREGKSAAPDVEVTAPASPRDAPLDRGVPPPRFGSPLRALDVQSMPEWPEIDPPDFRITRRPLHSAEAQIPDSDIAGADDRNVIEKHIHSWMEDISAAVRRRVSSQLEIEASQKIDQLRKEALGDPEVRRIKLLLAQRARVIRSQARRVPARPLSARTTPVVRRPGL